MEYGLERCPKRSEEIVSELELAKENGELEQDIAKYFLAYEMDMRAIWACREYLKALPMDYYRQNLHMVAYRVIIEAMSGNLEQVNEIAGFLGHTSDDVKVEDCTGLDIVRLMLELVLPQYDNNEFLRRIRLLTSIMKQPIKGLALTACRPSVINGFRDMTEFCPTMEEKRERIKKTIELVYGNRGAGVYEVALAEWKYETGDAFNALLLVAGTIPALEYAKDVRCVFVAYALQMRILVFRGQTKIPDGMYEKIRTKLRENYYEELEASLEATRCLYNCYEGNEAEITDWLENVAPDENEELFMMDIFPYFVKMRVYLQTGKYMMTVLLAKKLITNLKKSYRPHDMCECHLLMAISCLKAGKKELAYEEFDQALAIADQYGYVRVIADEGRFTLELLGLYQARVKEGHAIKEYNPRWISKIKKIAVEVDNVYPRYLTTFREEFETLTKMEKKVLVLVNAGLKNDDIADQLGVKTVTVKFHLSNIYRKLNVSNRQQAIIQAKMLEIL